MGAHLVELLEIVLFAEWTTPESRGLVFGGVGLIQLVGTRFASCDSYNLAVDEATDMQGLGRLVGSQTENLLGSQRLKGVPEVTIAVVELFADVVQGYMLVTVILALQLLRKGIQVEFPQSSWAVSWRNQQLELLQSLRYPVRGVLTSGRFPQGLLLDRCHPLPHTRVHRRPFGGPDRNSLGGRASSLVSRYCLHCRPDHVPPWCQS